MEHHDQMLIVRALRPFDEIGHVIGKEENSVKSVRKTSGAHVEIDDAKTDHIIKKRKMRLM